MTAEDNQKEYRFNLIEEFHTDDDTIWKVVALHFTCNPEQTLIPYKRKKIRTHALKQRSSFAILVSNAGRLKLIHDTLFLEQINERGPFSIFECKKTQDYFLQVSQDLQKKQRAEVPLKLKILK